MPLLSAVLGTDDKFEYISWKLSAQTLWLYDHLPGDQPAVIVLHSTNLSVFCAWYSD